tara:strand:- start:205 stop:459 length:255 start_codon:yes stop_codon:yes gene_type:complete
MLFSFFTTGKTKKAMTPVAGSRKQEKHMRSRKRKNRNKKRKGTLDEGMKQNGGMMSIKSSEYDDYVLDSQNKLNMLHYAFMSQG